MPHVKVGEKRGQPCNLWYTTHGQGSTKVLFVMGLFVSHRGWRPQVNGFRKEQPKEFYPLDETDDMFIDGYQICVFDNRGVGQSEAPSGRYTTKMMAQDALDLLQHLGWDHVHVVGISMGGMISLELALAMSDPSHQTPKLASLSLSCTHAGGRYAVPPHHAVVNILRALAITDPELRARNALPVLYSDEHLSDPARFDFYLKSTLERAKLDPPPQFNTFVGQLAAVMSHYVSEANLKKIRDTGVPILVLTGDADRMVRVQNSYGLNDILKPVEFLVFKGAGHACNSENKEEFNAALFRHFERGNKWVQSLTVSS